jgi:AcrR family transcriptional regulator
MAPHLHDSQATRADILAAATSAFLSRGYEDVGLREIAGGAGVDPAMINRYYGSKDALFRAVLAHCSQRPEFLDGDRAGFGKRIATALLLEQPPVGDFGRFLVVMRSMGSIRAIAAIREVVEERMVALLRQWIGGPKADARARLVIGVILGMAMSREIDPKTGLTPREMLDMRDQLAGILQSLIEPEVGHASDGAARLETGSP